MFKNISKIKKQHIVAALLFILSFSLYFYTASKDIPLVDSGELALAAANSGVAHPPGTPLYLIIGKLFSLLPLSTPVYTLNIMSAFFGAMTVACLFLFIERMLAFICLFNGNNRDSIRFIAGASGALAFMTSVDQWTWSGVTEVYTLNTFIFTAALASAWTVFYDIYSAIDVSKTKKLELRLRNKITDSSSPGSGLWAKIYLTCFLSSLSIANHYTTVFVICPVMFLLAFLGAPDLMKQKRFIKAVLVSILFSAGLYGYLFFAAHNDTGVGWGGIDNLTKLIHHMTGAQYLSSSSARSFRDVFLEMTKEYFRVIIIGCGIPTLIVLLVGVPLGIKLFIKKKSIPRRLLTATFIPIFVINYLLCVKYIAGPDDMMAYFLPSTVAWCAVAGIGIWSIINIFKKIPVPVAGTLAFGIILSFNMLMNFNTCNFSKERSGRTIVEETLAAIPENGILFTAEWNFYSPYIYMRHMENYRPHVKVIDILLMRRFWYVNYIEHTMPDLVAQSRSEFDAFKEQVTRFDLGMEYDHDAIQGLYEKLIHKWISIGLKTGGVWLDWPLYIFPQERSWTGSLNVFPQELVLGVSENVKTPVAVSMSPKNAENIKYLRSKITASSLDGNVSDLVPRHTAYYRLWSLYQHSVENSLAVAVKNNGKAVLPDLIRAYGNWYPEIENAKLKIR